MHNTIRHLTRVGGVFALGLSLAACGSGSSRSSGSGSSASDSTGGSAATGAASGAPVTGGAAQVNVTLTSSGGCELDHANAKAGPVTFTVTNKDATAITEIELQADQRILGEKENLAPGLAPVTFTVTLAGGKYQLYCPGADTENVPFTVSGKAAPTATGSTAALLKQGTTGYAGFVDQNVKDMVTAVGALKTAVDSGDVAKAKKAYAGARPYYEKIESDVAGFVLPGFKPGDNAGNLDYLIDMRASNLDPKVGWHGFHAVERDLWQGGKITPQTKKYAAELQTNVTKLSGLAAGLTYKPEDLANGAASLLEEVQTNKIKGEEEKYSHLDLVDFAANVEGAQQAFAFLKPGLTKIDPALTATVSKQFTNVNNALTPYRDGTELGGFKPWTAQRRAKDAASLSKTVQALQDPLSQIAQKVATAR
ncbi:iron uptake system protein EfeO [Flexivirga caeni]|uniref:Peptidase M75 family protein n=1 Tax=Flexivirga caeni TaxID=2294115 RepID=A0A3M9LWV2_9MICO|nr:iron uptake system protein EfeO [Flexivirga caeni]RNI17774.1 peptidase M75 family protein [Flexivirga caeni]